MTQNSTLINVFSSTKIWKMILYFYIQLSMRKKYFPYPSPLNPWLMSGERKLLQVDVFGPLLQFSQTVGNGIDLEVQEKGVIPRLHDSAPMFSQGFQRLPKEFNVDLGK